MLIEDGLVVFDNKDGISIQLLDAQEKGHVGMHGISGKDAPCYRQCRQKHQSHRDLIGFFLDLNLQ